MFIEEIIERMRRLPVDLQKEVLDYLEFLEKNIYPHTKNKKILNFIGKDA